MPKKRRPTTMHLPSGAELAGVRLAWRADKQCLITSGWSGLQQLPATAIKLRTLFKTLGITPADCRRAFRARSAACCDQV